MSKYLCLIVATMNFVLWIMEWNTTGDFSGGGRMGAFLGWGVAFLALAENEE